MKTINVSDTLAHNIDHARKDTEFVCAEKACIADALYAISSAKAELDHDGYILKKLDIAKEIIMSYLFYLDLFAQNP